MKMEASIDVQQMDFDKGQNATASCKEKFNSSSSTVSGTSSSLTGGSGVFPPANQATQASRPMEPIVQGIDGKNPPDDTCTAKDRGRLGGFFEWLLKPAKRTASRLHLRPGKKGKKAAGSIRQSPKPPLSALFFGLPTELQLEVIYNLPLNDIIQLRKTSRFFSNLVQSHENHIAKQYIKNWMPKYISILFPTPTTEPATLRFLQDVTYRREVSDQLADLLARRIVKEMGQGVRMRRQPIKPKVLEYVIERLKIGFSPLILAVFHFLETYHTRKVQKMSVIGLSDGSTFENMEFQIQSDIMSQYPDWLLLKVHQMYHLLLHLLTKRLTAPPFISFRPIGRWNHIPPWGKRLTEEDVAKVLLLGGIPEVLRVYKIKGQGKRKKALDKYLRSLDTQDQTDQPIKRHGGIVKADASISIDRLSQIWVPAAEKQILSRRIVPNLESIRCCGEFVAELLGDEFNSADDGSVVDQEENPEDRASNAQIFAAMQWTSVNLRKLADDGSWDRNLIAEEEDEDYAEAIIENGKEGHGDKRPTTPPSKPVAGPSRTPGTIVGMTAPVPMTSGIGYNGMGANFMTMAL